MKRSQRAAIATVLALTSLVAAAPVAHADERTCELNPDTNELKCRLIASPAPPLSRRLSRDLPLVWKRIPFDIEDLIARGRGCIRDRGGVTEIGAGYVIALINEDTGELLYLEGICTFPGEPPPSPPPPPPTPGEFTEANADVLALDPSFSPGAAIGGLTGLDSWLWCDDPGTVAVGVNLRGWTATGSVRLVQVGWTLDGPEPTAATSTSCGSEAAPSTTWTPETMGDYSVTLTSTWAGSWNLTWGGADLGAFPLGPVSIDSAPSAYPVDEYRGELTG